MITEKISRPQSATNPWVGLIGLVVLGITLPFVLQNEMPAYMRTLFVVLPVAFSMCFLDIFAFKAHKRISTGIDWSMCNYNIPRIATKLIGLGFIFCVLAALYLTFPIYQTNSYANFWNALLLMAPYLMVAAVAYVIILDGVMSEPEDAYYALGNIVLLKRDKANYALLAPLARSWLIKGYFIPAMFSFLSNNMEFLPEKIQEGLWYLDRNTLFIVALTTIYTIDLIYALIGYVFALRVIDTHERSSDPTMIAWVSALVCYPPFWEAIQTNFLDYEGPQKWFHLFANNEPLLITWAFAILFLIGIYTWATISFGCRFSNLTHRGIITNGPYRFTKHPAYISKNLSWWLVSVPFLAFPDVFEATRHCVMLLMLNGIYFIRARTEEKHLANDPTYRDYQAYIAEHGIFRMIKTVRNTN
jgi:protein-S-isoprenylcysteine O-methyltransferase Ste14